MRYDINLEIVGLIYAVCICIIHRITRRENIAAARAFQKTLVINVIAVTMDIVTAITINNYQTVNPFVNQILSCIYYFFFVYMIFCLCIYGSRLASEKEREPFGGFLIKAIFVMDTFFLILNIFSGHHLYFYFDETGYHYATLYALAVALPVMLLIIFIAKLLQSNSEQIRRKKKFIISSIIISVFAGGAELLIEGNSLFFGLGSTICLTIILMCIETPEYTWLTQTMRNYNNDLEKEADERTRQITAAKNSLIAGMAQFIEEQNGTPGHLKRTCDLANMLIEELKINSTDAHSISLFDDMQTAAPLHELGRLNLPKELATKKDGFTDEERRILSENARNGAAIVRHILSECNDKELTQTAENMVLYKNENYNGSGYPDGLARTKIPLEARIMAVADEFDRLIGCGPSQNASAVDKAISSIESRMGTHFDPKMIEPIEALRSKIKAYYQIEMPQMNKVRI